MKKLAAVAILVVLSAFFALPAHAQLGSCSGRIVCGPEDGSGGGTGCWNCVHESGATHICGHNNRRCKQAGHNQQGEGISCSENEWWPGCYACQTSNGACLNTDVYG